jgi:GNAT superfamily N-acetyltransferase
MSYAIRPARPDDAEAVVAMTHALNEHDKRTPVLMDAATFRRDGFAEPPAFRVFVAEDEAGALIGYTLWYPEYDALGARRGAFMEDLWVDPSARGSGLARRLMAAIARENASAGGRYLAWMAKKDNAVANAFYAKVGEAAPEYVSWSSDGTDFAALLGPDDG